MPYYSSGFLEPGSAQTGTGLSSLFDFGSKVLESILPRLGGGPGSARVPTTQPAPGSATRPPAEHMPGPMGGPGRRGRIARVGIPAAGVAVAAGYHLIKKGPHAGEMTKNRHRNVGNIRALRRAISRLHGFERVCRKVVHFVKPHQKGRIVFRGRKKRS